MKVVAKNVSRTFYRKSKSTNYFYAVHPCDFTLEEGKITALIGRSGSGKTTLSQILCGLVTPDTGVVLIDERDLYALSDDERSQLRNQSFGIIPQGQTGLLSLTVLENVLAPVMMYGDPREKEERAKELLKRVDILDLQDVYANELSGGEMRRMAIARALINEPSLLIADEPTSDLDDQSTLKVLSIFQELAKQGVSILMVTHEKDALSFADDVYRMENGTLTYVENPEL